MSKRLQVLLDDGDYAELSRTAASRGLTVSEWVRQAIRAAQRREPDGDVARKLAVLRTAMQHSFPAPDIEQMLEETERGFLVDAE